jgi:phosphoribosylformylglycinamidine cyclo-ligase
MNYKEAGVDLEEGYRAVGKYRELAEGTLGPLRGSVLGSVGGFAGMISLGAAAAGMTEPVLVSGTDGVGTKLDLAFRMNRYDTVGIDCVAMCVNDILCQGARPLFFLDYLACGRLDAEKAAALVRGVAAGCREARCALLGGETAEMPGFYADGVYDIAGFAVGLVDRAAIVDGRALRPGDALVGLLSSGPHSNGFSLIRRAVPDPSEDFGGMPVGAALIEPTRIYVRPVLGLMERAEVRAMAHITGGGFYENIPRMFSVGEGREEVSPLASNHEGFPLPPLRGGSPSATPPPGLDAVIRDGSWPVPPIFERIAAGIAGDGRDGTQAIADAEIRRFMFNTFNMGIGFVLALPPKDVSAALEYLDGQGFPAREIGRVEWGSGSLRFE